MQTTRVVIRRLFDPQIGRAFKETPFRKGKGQNSRREVLKRESVGDSLEWALPGSLPPSERVKKKKKGNPWDTKYSRLPAGLLACMCCSAEDAVKQIPSKYESVIRKKKRGSQACAECLYTAPSTYQELLPPY